MLLLDLSSIQIPTISRFLLIVISASIETFPSRDILINEGNYFDEAENLLPRNSG